MYVILEESYLILHPPPTWYTKSSNFLPRIISKEIYLRWNSFDNFGDELESFFGDIFVHDAAIKTIVCNISQCLIFGAANVWSFTTESKVQKK